MGAKNSNQWQKASSKLMAQSSPPFFSLFLLKPDIPSLRNFKHETHSPFSATGFFLAVLHLFAIN
jgi:hypothetical protein